MNMNQNVTFNHLGKPLNLFTDQASAHAPGKGNVTIKSLSLSENRIIAGQSLTLSAQIEGEQIAHIFVVAYLIKDGFAYGPIHQEFCTAPLSKTVGDVTYPQWEGKINLLHPLTLETPLLTNGIQQSFGVAVPQTYGAKDQEQQYQVIGWYSQPGTSVHKKARLRFNVAGKLSSIMVVGGKTARTAREITPQAGDIFIPQARCYPMEEDTISMDEGKIMQADEITLSWTLQRVMQPALPGEVFIGVLLEDMDGKHYQQCLRCTVESPPESR
jgi:hypothetical protein